VDRRLLWVHGAITAWTVCTALQESLCGIPERGLEVVALTFEYSSDHLSQKEHLAVSKRYGHHISDSSIGGSTQEANITARLHSQLNNFSAYSDCHFYRPNRNRNVFIHAGFHGREPAGNTGIKLTNIIHSSKPFFKQKRGITRDHSSLQRTIQLEGYKS